MFVARQRVFLSHTFSRILLLKLGGYDKRIDRPGLRLDIHILVRRNMYCTYAWLCKRRRRRRRRSLLEWDRSDRQRMWNTWKSSSSIIKMAHRRWAYRDRLSTNNPSRHVNSDFDHTVYQPNAERRLWSSALPRFLPVQSINENNCLHNHTLDHNYRLLFSSARERERNTKSNYAKTIENQSTLPIG